MTGSSRVVCTVFAVALALLPDPGHGIELFLDLDANPATGCTVTTVDGPFAGVEQVLEAGVTVQGVAPGGAFVTDLTRRECTDPGTNAFGPSIAVDPGGWPVEYGLGTDGSDPVEVYWPLAAAVERPSSILLGVEVADADALLGVGVSLSEVSVLEVPTLSEWGALLLILALASLAVHRLRRSPRAAWLVVTLGLGLGMATAAWAACVLDGQVGDWAEEDLVGLDPVGDGVPDRDDLRAVFVQECADRLCFRVDVFLEFLPVP